VLARRRNFSLQKMKIIQPKQIKNRSGGKGQIDKLAGILIARAGLHLER
jgi:hypothetical protein